MDRHPSTEPVFPEDPQMHTLLGWFFILIALPLAVWMFLRIGDKLDSRTWPRVNAEIVRSELYKRTPTKGSPDWCIKLSYRYQVDGKSYTSNRISTSRMGDTGCDPSRAVMQARLERQQPGAHIGIRHAPGQPERAIVYVGALDISDFFFPVLACVTFAGGVGALRSARRLRMEQAAFAADRRARMQQALARQLV